MSYVSISSRIIFRFSGATVTLKGSTLLFLTVYTLLKMKKNAGNALPHATHTETAHITHKPNLETSLDFGTDFLKFCFYSFARACARAYPLWFCTYVVAILFHAPTQSFSISIAAHLALFARMSFPFAHLSMHINPRYIIASPYINLHKRILGIQRLKNFFRMSWKIFR